MNYTELQHILDENREARVSFVLPDGSSVPQHFHVTEVGYVRKDFFDCGGVRRIEEYCALQLWVATDLEHQLVSEKVASILRHTKDVIPREDIEVQVEYQKESLSTYRIDSVQRVFGKLTFQLSVKSTACLAPDQCGVTGCC